VCGGNNEVSETEERDPKLLLTMVSSKVGYEGRVEWVWRGGVETPSSGVKVNGKVVGRCSWSLTSRLSTTFTFAWSMLGRSVGSIPPTALGTPMIGGIIHYFGLGGP